MHLRPSTTTDHPAILRLHREAFGPEEGPVIAQLVEGLLGADDAQPLLSLLAVAAEDDEGTPQHALLGHVLFSRVRLTPRGEGAASDHMGLAHILAPLAVRPDQQGQGIGSALVRDGLRRLRGIGSQRVFVLGDPAYYGRFGFVPALPLGLFAPHPLPEAYREAWRVLPLGPAPEAGVIGETTVHCAAALEPATYWQ